MGHAKSLLLVDDKQPKVGCDGNWQCWITDPDGVRIEIMQLAAGSPQMNAMTDQ